MLDTDLPYPEKWHGNVLSLMLHGRRISVAIQLKVIWWDEEKKHGIHTERERERTRGNQEEGGDDISPVTPSHYIVDLDESVLTAQEQPMNTHESARRNAKTTYYREISKEGN